ncbi:hypothetical protein D9611_009751 [Ephemerocybe angulata]|uniref:Nucleoplasmin-like domain-containing protein n=1 Tax=Ephemerocybe angulata TaxID=980116 RepID=A0A8H5FG10_9AGAR|nr:hypothetical protein D9611_009751 [Tulosesus angulatus]
MSSWFSAKVDAGTAFHLRPTLRTTITNACIAQKNPIEEGTRGSLIFTAVGTPEITGPIARFVRYTCEQVLLNLELEAGREYIIQAQGSFSIDLVGSVELGMGEDAPAALHGPGTPPSSKACGKRKACDPAPGQSAPKRRKEISNLAEGSSRKGEAKQAALDPSRQGTASKREIAKVVRVGEGEFIFNRGRI